MCCVLCVACCLLVLCVVSCLLFGVCWLVVGARCVLAVCFRCLIIVGWLLRVCCCVAVCCVFVIGSCL